MKVTATLAALCLAAALGVGIRPAPAAPKTAAGPKAAPKAKADPRLIEEAARFLALYDSIDQKIYSTLQENDWAASTDVTPEHDGGRVAAGKAFAAFSGNKAVIERARELLARRAALEPLQARQLDKILLTAAEAPGTIPEIVARRIEAEGRQSSLLDSFEFCLERAGDTCRRPTTALEIDNLLESSRDLDQRLAVWKASKESGPPLKPGLVELRDLRNAVAREMGYSSFFGLQVADYDMTSEEMMTMLSGFLTDMEPLYRELHCWTRDTLARRYGKPATGPIPAHWIDNRWSQNWPGIVEGVDLDPLFKGKTAEWVVRQAEAFYVSLGFPKLPPVFWEKSDLYPVPAGSQRKKNTHASAWDIDLVGDVRSLMSLEGDAESFSTAHHELGHIYYYLSYDRPGVPMPLRDGANRAFHEGIGELIGMASAQVPYLRQVGLLPADRSIDTDRWLLNEALEKTVPFIPWSAGTMSHFEHDLYEKNLPADRFNARWWEYVRRFQGVAPPEPRGE
ncbi:MAG TPA: M2 family metallopeptidase, partial [Candidatus Polarisedimenticolia bacterium]|nr:M2 family metallopeptidase [Candidatus Polarisedimenticolia bacterium]